MQRIVFAPATELHATVIKPEQTSGPVLGVDHHHTGRPDDEVIQVRRRPGVLATVVQDVPASATQDVQPLADLTLPLVAEANLVRSAS